MNLTKNYAKAHEILHDKLGINLPGLGFLMRKTINEDLYVEAWGQKLFVDHRIADHYIHLINGTSNEKETRLFINNVLAKNTLPELQFIDVGANVGEFIIATASNPIFKNVVGFEPLPIQFAALINTVKANNYSNCKIINKALSNKIEDVNFNFSSPRGHCPGIVSNTQAGSEKLQTSTIDNEIFADLPTIILIDVEGYELNVMKGGINFINKVKPLIIFEYNHITKNHFTIQDVEYFLGKDYEIFRLNSSGNLDKNFSKTWNLVAISNESVFSNLAKNS